MKLACQKAVPAMSGPQESAAIITIMFVSVCYSLVLRYDKLFLSKNLNSKRRGKINLINVDKIPSFRNL
jgi:hypothetical protein